MESDKKIKVLIVDDHLVVRKGFSTMLKVFDDIELVGEASTGYEAITISDEVCPDVVLVDMMMPEMNGIKTIQTMRQSNDEMRFIAMTSFTEDDFLVREAIEAGALGYVFKDISISDLADAIRTVYRDKPFIPMNAMQLLIQSTHQRTSSDFRLTDRELEILELIIEGMSNRAIAQQLVLSESTVKFHVSSILGKLGAKSRTEAAKIANQNNLFSS